MLNRLRPWGDTPYESTQSDPLAGRPNEKIWNASRFCVSSLRRGHANLLCIVPILVYVPPKRVRGTARPPPAYVAGQAACDIASGCCSRPGLSAVGDGRAMATARRPRSRGDGVLATEREAVRPVLLVTCRKTAPRIDLLAPRLCSAALLAVDTRTRTRTAYTRSSPSARHPSFDLVGDGMKP